MPISANRKLRVSLAFSGMVAFVLLRLSGSHAQSAPATSSPTFYRELLPSLEKRCQGCHRAGGIAPMPFETHEETRPFAGAIARATQDKSMPPWFADPKVGQFSNDPSLKPAEIRTLAAWADAKSPAGNAKDAQSSRLWVEGWSIPKPDLILTKPRDNGDMHHGIHTLEMQLTHPGARPCGSGSGDDRIVLYDECLRRTAWDTAVFRVVDSGGPLRGVITV